MPKPTTKLAARLQRIREQAGYGNKRQAAAFARLIGVAASSLHNLESGRSRDLGKSLPGYLRIGASLEYIEKGRGRAFGRSASGCTGSGR